MIVFPTCAIMHGVYAYLQVKGVYADDLHMSILDWISVPAAMYFLWVVHSLYRGAFHDWNGAPEGGLSTATPEPARA